MLKQVRHPGYNYDFDTVTGTFFRWGNTHEEDPQVSPLGPEIADIEVTTSCAGRCKFCYKSNNLFGTNMSFETFKTIFDKLPANITQIAFGADSSATANPDLFHMMEYCRENNVIPNITVADITIETANVLSTLCGAVAVSHYNTDICRKSIDFLHRCNLKQINIHQMVSEETLEECYNIMDEAKNIQGLNALVFLSLKRKGRGKYFNPLPQYLFNDMIDYAIERSIPMGFDSCTSHKFMKYVEDSGNPDLRKLVAFVEPCESMLFSIYIDVYGKAWPCSFSPNTLPYLNGIDILQIEDFMTDVWNAPEILHWREGLLSGNRKCPIYSI